MGQEVGVGGRAGGEALPEMESLDVELFGGEESIEGAKFAAYVRRLAETVSPGVVLDSAAMHELVSASQVRIAACRSGHGRQQSCCFSGGAAVSKGASPPKLLQDHLLDCGPIFIFAGPPVPLRAWRMACRRRQPQERGQGRPHEPPRRHGH